MGVVSVPSRSPLGKNGPLKNCLVFEISWTGCQPYRFFSDRVHHWYCQDSLPGPLLKHWALKGLLDFQ